MAPDQEGTAPKQEKRPNELKDLSPRDETADAADKIKGGAVGPCNRSTKKS